MTQMSFLKTKGTKIIDGNGNPIILKGTASGGHLNMENFISGYPGHETEHKEVLLKVMGKEKFDYFFDKFYDYFWTEADADFYKNTLGLNCLRIPFNYHHFLDDEGDLFEVKQKGFDLLDRMVDICAKYGIYVILDLHTTPLAQGHFWPSDFPSHHNFFWTYKFVQDAVVNLWSELAKHYASNVWVAGYNPLNEPAVEDGSKLAKYYDRLEKAIRTVDPNHILFLDANTYSIDFSSFPDIPYPNSVYAIHDYATAGFPNREGILYSSTDTERAKIRRKYEDKIHYMKEKNVPIWNGEFGPVYASESRGDTNVEAINTSRYKVLEDQLEVYKTGDPSGDGSPISWSIWLYKDIGLQGMTYVSPNSKWMKHFKPWLEKKQRLGLDMWGRDTAPEVQKKFDDFYDFVRETIPEKFHEVKYPKMLGLEGFCDRITRDLLLANYLIYEYAEYFRDLSFEELDELAASFKFENLEQREELNNILIQY